MPGHTFEAQRASPIRLWPTQGRHLAQVEEDLLILDVAGDRYDCVPEAGEVLRFIDGVVETDDIDVVAMLEASGAFSTGAPKQANRQATFPSRELHPIGQAGWALRALAAVSLVTAAFRFRRLSFAELVSDYDIPRNRGFIDEVRLAACVSAAEEVLPLIPFEGVCLKRAYQLRHFLRSQGVATDWVFGVRTWPFAAHCWLQVGDMLIADRLERVRRYTPILVV